MSESNDISRVRDTLVDLRTQISKQIVGHHDVIDGILAALLAGGHVLLEGVPGLGKTLIVKTLSNALDLDFSRIQFTPDLMPADIIGTRIVIQREDGGRHFEFQQGPVFTQILLADEINRATPKTQSALLEAMEEKRVTVGSTAHRLQEPFMVLATQNPIEMEGTYPLPEAQLDRFLLKLNASYPDADELSTIVDRATGQDSPEISAVLDQSQVLEFRHIMRSIVIAQHVKEYAVNIVLATHPESINTTPEVQQYVRHGASPRGLLSMILMAKSLALFDGRINVSFDDLRKAASPALRHRILLNFEGEAEGTDIDMLISTILSRVPFTDGKTAI